MNLSPPSRIRKLVPRAVTLMQYGGNHREAYSKIQNKIGPTVTFVKSLHELLIAGTLKTYSPKGDYDIHYNFDPLEDHIKAHRVTLHQKNKLTTELDEDEGKFIEFFTGLNNCLRLDLGIRMGVTNQQNPPVIHMHPGDADGPNSFNITDSTERDRTYLK